MCSCAHTVSAAIVHNICRGRLDLEKSAQEPVHYSLGDCKTASDIQKNRERQENFIGQFSVIYREDFRERFSYTEAYNYNCNIEKKSNGCTLIVVVNIHEDICFLVTFHLEISKFDFILFPSLCYFISLSYWYQLYPIPLLGITTKIKFQEECPRKPSLHSFQLQ